MGKCSRCGAYVFGYPKNCPKCGVEFKRLSWKALLAILIVLLLLAGGSWAVYQQRKVQRPSDIAPKTKPGNSFLQQHPENLRHLA
jgi:cytoskeletal protein RodZ